MPEKKLREELEVFHTYLRQNGLKKTYQKDLILETFLSAEGHFSVEDVYAMVKRRDRKIGIVTVFRTLKSLTASGLAREVVLGDGLTRFEHCYRHPQHHHIICTSCGKTIEFLSPELEKLQAEIVGQYDFEAVHHRLQIYGMCENCRLKRGSEESPRCDTQSVFARDAVRMAIGVEGRALQFYREAAERNQDPLGRQILEQIEAEERIHFSALESELQSICDEDPGIERAPVFLHFDPAELERMIPDIREYESEGALRLSPRQALEVAMLIEKRAADFFRGYADGFLETRGKQIFQRFAAEEARHCVMISRRMEQALAAT